MARPKLIITADDYGLNAACNQGIIEGVNAGIVSSVHVMVNMVDQQEMDSLKMVVANARNNGHSVGIGLHLNTTWGPASIQEDASFKNPYGHMEHWDVKYSYWRIDQYIMRQTIQEEMLREMEFQFNQLSDYLGGADQIDAISSHQNIHIWHEPYLDKVIELAKRGDCCIRSPRRWSTTEIPPIPPKYEKGTRPLTLTARKYLDAWGALGLLTKPLHAANLQYLHDLIKNGGIRTPENSAGHWFGQPSEKALTWFMESLANLNSANQGYASEIFMHLSSNPSNAYTDHRWDYGGKKRYEEYKVLKDAQDAFHAKKNDLNIQLGSYRDVLS